MIRWYHLFLYFFFLQASAQYSYTYTDPCTLQSHSVFVPAGGGVMVSYFDNHNIFTANDFSSGAFDTWIAQVSQQNSSSPCQSITTTITNNVNTAVVSNTVSILTNVVAISSLAQSMASISSTIGSTMTSTAGGISSMDLGNSVDNNQTNSNEKTDNKDGGNSGSVGSNQTNNQNEGSSSSGTTTGGNNSPTGGASTSQGGTSANTNQPTQGRESTTQSPIGTSGQATGTSPTSTSTNTTPSTVQGTPGNISQSVPTGTDTVNSTASTGTQTTTATTQVNTVTPNQTGTNEVANTTGEGSIVNSISNVVDGGSSDSSAGGGSTSSSSKKQANAKTSSGSLIASGDMVAISSADKLMANQYKFVGSITHANTRGTRIKGVLFNFTTVVNNMNVTLYKSWINKKRTLNLIVANSTMMDFEKNFFNTTTGLESYKVNKKVTAMFGLNFTAGKMGEREFLNLSAVGGGHFSIKVSNRTSTSFLTLAVYSPFTQFYDGKWWNAGVLVVPFNSWDFRITKTFKYNVSFTGVYEMNQSFLNYQVLTGGKITF